MNINLTTSEAVQPPPERFNIAAHFLAENAHRSAEEAFIDDTAA